MQVNGSKSVSICAAAEKWIGDQLLRGTIVVCLSDSKLTPVTIVVGYNSNLSLLTIVAFQQCCCLSQLFEITIVAGLNNLNLTLVTIVYSVNGLQKLKIGRLR